MPVTHNQGAHHEDERRSVAVGNNAKTPHLVGTHKAVILRGFAMY
jgi:hypothetical protein